MIQRYGKYRVNGRRTEVFHDKRLEGWEEGMVGRFVGLVGPIGQVRPIGLGGPTKVVEFVGQVRPVRQVGLV